MDSASVRNLKGFADSNNIIIFSPSSTSPALSIPGDNIFRLVTDDNFQGQVIAGLVKQAGIEHAVIVWRGDDWGDGLHDATVQNLKKLGIEAVDGPRYSPEAKDFSAEVNQLADTVDKLVKQYGADKVGVVLICFQEGVQFMIQSSQYDVLGQVRWFGSDGLAKATPLTSDPTAAAFAEKTKFEAPIAALEENPKTESLKQRFVQILGREPETYAYNSYDIAWILTFSLLTVNDYNATKVKAVLPEIANDYFGVTGWTKLNEAGDRAFANYFVWTVVSQAGEYKWSLVGIYDTTSNKLIQE
jgi:branched-chain amino acid transport system substrate-binding protein